MPSYVVKNAPADEKEGKMECQQRCFLIGRGKIHKGGWGGRNTRGDSSYNDTANALIETKKSAIDSTRREIIGI